MNSQLIDKLWICKGIRGARANLLWTAGRLSEEYHVRASCVRTYVCGYLNDRINLTISGEIYASSKYIYNQLASDD
jgi:hypothetical protein